MAFLTEEKFHFVSESLPGDTFGVVEFQGEEGLSIPYRFDILLVSEDMEIDFDQVVGHPARLTLHRDEGGDVDFHGTLADFEQLNAVGRYVFYRATLVPRLWWLTLTHHNQVFLDKTVQEIAEAVLQDAGLSSVDYEFRLKDDYPKSRFVCQYGETHFNFLSRRLEREGLYYFFEQTPSGEKIVFTDTAIAQTECTIEGCIRYAPPSGLNETHRQEIIHRFTCRQGTIPGKIRLKDYNYRKPSLDISAAASVDLNGRGEVYYYGEHFPSPKEGDRLAKILAEEIICRKREFNGESTIACLQPGYTFDLEYHYRDSFNQKYLTVQITHEGCQSGYLISGIAQGLTDREKKVYYRNRFKAIPAKVQFRPARQTPRPKISSTLHGIIDAAGGGEYAVLDEHGRYKVILPFDLSGRKEGKASAWLRMAQPYAGTGHGMHFPLHKGTEVLLSFIEGNPNRPVIAGAIPNYETPSPVTSKDGTMSKITTAGGNKIHIEDKQDSQRILLHSPSANTWIRMGTPDGSPDFSGSEQNTSLKELQAEVDQLNKQLEELKEKEKKDVDEDEVKKIIQKEAEKDEGYHISTDGISVTKIGNGKWELIYGEEKKLVMPRWFKGWNASKAYEDVEQDDGPTTKKLVADYGHMPGGNVFETIVGAEEKFVGGNVLETIGGFEEKIVVGNSFDTVVGAEEKIILGVAEIKAVLAGKSIQFELTKSHFSTMEEHITGEINELAGATTRMVGETTKMIGENTQMIGKTTRMVGENTIMMGSIVEMATEGNEMVVEMLETVGDSIKTIGNGTVLQGERTTTCGEQTLIVGNNTELAGEQVRMAETHTNLAVNNTTMAEVTLIL